MTARVLLAFLVVPFLTSTVRAQDPRHDVAVTDGIVKTSTTAGGVLYIGGQFHNVGPPTGAGVPTNAITGTPIAASFPKVTGEIWTVISDGLGGWYIGGKFFSVGGLHRNCLAHILSDYTVAPWAPDIAEDPDNYVSALALSGNTVYIGGNFLFAGLTADYLAAANATTGAINLSWTPNPNNHVWCLTVFGGTLYAGGAFNAVFGVARSHIAAFEIATGALTAWNPGANSDVEKILVSGGTVYAGGYFTTFGGAARNYIGAVPTSADAATAWNPNGDGAVLDLALNGSDVIAGGQFSTIGGALRPALAALSTSTGLATAWHPSVVGSVNRLAVAGSTVYFGGAFGSAGGSLRPNFAAVSTVTGELLPWNPRPNGPGLGLAVFNSTVYIAGAFTSVGSVPRESLAAIDVATGAVLAWDPNPSPSPTINAIAVSGTKVYVVGDFTMIGGQSRNGLAAVSKASGLATPWAPNSSTGINCLAVGYNTVYVGGSFLTQGGEGHPHLAGFDATTGAVRTFLTLNILGGDVLTMLLHQGKLYFGGTFQNVGIQGHHGAAALLLATDQLTNWNPALSNGAIVRAFGASGGTIYAGGDFTSTRGQPRVDVAAFDSTGGAPTTWNAGLDGAPAEQIYAVAIGDSTIFLGGTFTDIAGNPRAGLAGVHQGSGATSGWDPAPSGLVYSLAVSGTNLLAAGDFPSFKQFSGSQPEPLSNVAGFFLPAVSSPPDTSGAVVRGLVEDALGESTLDTPNTRWQLFPNACTALSNGTFTPSATAVVDNLDAYAVGTTGDYSVGGGAVGLPHVLAAGDAVPSADLCSPSKTASTDHFFYRSDLAAGTTNPAPSWIQTCAIPVPASLSSAVASWSVYDDMPRGSGFRRYTQYRVFKLGTWSGWKMASPSGRASVGTTRGWSKDSAVLMEVASAAESVQVRFVLDCQPSLGSDHTQCTWPTRTVLYDDFSLSFTPGVAPPQIGIFPGSIAQSTFVDGSMTGTNCTSTPCWPGIRGSDLGGLPDGAILDNFNSPLGDSIVVVLRSSVRSRGMGLNWRHGYSRSLGDGRTANILNDSYNSSYDVPRMIFRIFNPGAQLWSPWDSTEMDADDVFIAPSDSTVLGDAYRVTWPPRDKLASGAALPGGFTINGAVYYSQLAFLQRGVRVQYYFKAVDIAGGTTYRFTTDFHASESVNTPTLPGTVLRAPDILEFDVLPGVYAAGTAGTLLAGVTQATILDLDDSYSLGTLGFDPMSKVLNLLGVRADRYRLLQSLETGNNIGGHELAGQRVALPSNYFPNKEEYGIIDSLAAWYRMVLVSSHKRSWPVFDEQDAAMIADWWRRETGTDGGDRCLFANGDNFFQGIMNTVPPMPPIPSVKKVDLAQNTLGVESVTDSWAGTGVDFTPTVDDRFAAPASGPGLAPPGSYLYALNGGCPRTSRFDALLPRSAIGAKGAATYPASGGIVDTSAVVLATELDNVPDHDLNKAVSYAYSIQSAGVGFTGSLLVEKQILYKFITSCRGPRNGGGASFANPRRAPEHVEAADTASCYPCPAPTNYDSNWATGGASFQIGTYGPLYAVQDPFMVSAVEPPSVTAPRVFRNSLLQNRPNPFNPTTIIPYSLASNGRVTIRIFDVNGRCIRVLVDAVKAAGEYVMPWNGVMDSGTKAASGVYFYRITYPDGGASAKKMIMLK